MPPEFEEIIQQNRPRIYRIAQRYAAPGGVDDLYQEILIQLWRSFNSFRGESTAATWLYRIAFNTAMTQMRSRLRKQQQEYSFTVEEISVPEDRCQADILVHFLNLLSEIDASVLIMYLDGLSVADIANVLGISANAVSIRVNRMKQKFSDTYVD